MHIIFRVFVNIILAGGDRYKDITDGIDAREKYSALFITPSAIEQTRRTSSRGIHSVEIGAIMQNIVVY
jgi:hypothetical protein